MSPAALNWIKGYKMLFPLKKIYYHYRSKYHNTNKSNDFVDKIVRFVYNIIEKKVFSL